MLFDHTGKCIFRGQTDDATMYVKEAIGAGLVKRTGVSEPPMVLKAAFEMLDNGEPLAAVAAKAQTFVNSSDASIAEPAKKLMGVITEPGTKMLEEAQGLKKTDPLAAFLLAEQVAVKFKGLSVAGKANSLADSLRGNKDVLLETAARRDFATVEKVEKVLAGQPGAFEPRSPRFQAENAALLKQLKDAVAVMRKKHATTKCTEKAGQIAKDYAVE